MTEQLPSVARANVDGDGPAKRTRRPALSCIECRKRKVKCDRREPCGACVRIKSEKCTYRLARAGIRCGIDRPPVVTSTSGNNTSNDRPSSQSSRAPDELDLTADRYIAPGVLGEHGRPKPKPLPAQRPTFDLSSHADTGASSLVSILLKENQELRTAVAKDAFSGDGTRPISDILTDIPGSFQKSKFFGQSHWMNALEPYEALGTSNTRVNPTTDRVEVNKSTELYKAVDELKTMGRVLKTARMQLPAILPEALNSLPSKDVCDALVDGYLRTFEGVFRVLHVPSFRKEYDDHWSGRVHDKPSVLLKIMLVCALGVPFYTGPDQPRLRVTCANWIQAADNWLAAPHAKSRLNMAGLQIHILVLLARQVCNVEGDHVWMAAGSLLRTAMYLGLHRDPSYFGKINTFHAEMRRRLWATVLELTVQSSLDMGMPPMVSVQEYDTKPPSNVNDEEISEQNNSPLNEKPSDTCTECSIQIAFAETLPIRLEITRRINSLRFDVPYQECLRLSTELTETCHSHTQFFKKAFSTGAPIAPFQIKLLDSLVRRFTLALHRPFFAKAKDNPEYHFSRRTCLDASIAIFAPATAPVPGQNDDWTLMTHRAVGFFKALFLYALSTIYFELCTQLSEALTTAHLTAPLISNTPAQPQQHPSSTPLHAALDTAHHIALSRIRNGETNAKGVVFIACARARIAALLDGVDPEASVLEAAKAAVRQVRGILAEAYYAEHGERIELAFEKGDGLGLHGRGEGADDVTGRGEVTGSGGFVDGVDRAAFGASIDAVMAGGGTDDPFSLSMASQHFPPGEDMDTFFQSLFSQDPEWYYDANLGGTINDTSGF